MDKLMKTQWVSDSEVPDILLAFADGIEEHIRKYFSGTVQRTNNHDIQSSQPRAFAPMLSLFSGRGLLFINVGSECLEFWDHNGIQKAEPHAEQPSQIVPTCCLDYSHPDLMQQILVTITRHFEEKSNE